MNESQFSEAFVEALQDQKVIKLIADLTAKNLVKLKSNPSSDEGVLVKKHIVFATAEQEGEFMTVKQITEKLIEINDSYVVRPRVFGKALMEDVIELKNGRQGKEYKIAAILGNVSDYIPALEDENPDQVKMEFPPENEVFDDKVENESEKPKIADISDVDDIQDVADEIEEKAAEEEEKVSKKDKKKKKKKKKSKKD